MTGTLPVPREHADSLPCVLRADLFTDPLLDVGLDDETFVALPSAEQHAQVAKKQALERECVLACQACPIVQQCREWALRTHVHGVAGAMTERERAVANGLPTPDRILEVTSADEQVALRDEQIYRMTVAGYPTAVIAQSLGVNERTVQRRRKEIREHGFRARRTAASDAPQAKAAGEASRREVEPHEMTVTTIGGRRPARSSSVNTGRVSDLTTAIYRHLAGGLAVNRDDVIEAVEHLVNPEQAARRNGGARQVVLNRIRIAVREGRIHSVVHNKTTYLKLDDAIRAQFAAPATVAS